MRLINTFKLLERLILFMKVFSGEKTPQPLWYFPEHIFETDIKMADNHLPNARALQERLYSYVQSAPDHHQRPQIEQIIQELFYKSRQKTDPATGLRYCVSERSLSQNVTPFFQVFWPAGRFLAQSLTAQHGSDLITSKRVASIGAGSGLAEMHLFKNLHPACMACIDSEPYARAAIELNAKANGVALNGNFVVMDSAHCLRPVDYEQKPHRLFDTVLACDLLYGQDTARAKDIKRILATLTELNQQGVDVIIAERDYVEYTTRLHAVGRRLEVRTDELHQLTRTANGLRDDDIMASGLESYDRDTLQRIGVVSPVFDEVRVNIFHWPAQNAQQPLPRFDAPWWQPAPSA
jgi:predicted nicotinamide N-methyase